MVPKIGIRIKAFNQFTFGVLEFGQITQVNKSKGTLTITFDKGPKETNKILEKQWYVYADGPKRGEFIEFGLPQLS